LSKYCFNFFLGECENSWDHKWLDKFDKGIFVSLSGVWNLFLLKLSEENKSWSSDSVFFGTIGISSVNKLNFILNVSIWNMNISEESISLSTKISNKEFSSSGLLLKDSAGDFT
jgi:hypothetical protein